MSNTPTFSSPLDDERISLPKVIYYLQVLAGMHPGDQPKPEDKQEIIVIGTGGITGVYYPTGNR